MDTNNIKQESTEFELKAPLLWRKREPIGEYLAWELLSGGEVVGRIIQKDGALIFLKHTDSLMRWGMAEMLQRNFVQNFEQFQNGIEFDQETIDTFNSVWPEYEVARMHRKLNQVLHK